MPLILLSFINWTLTAIRHLFGALVVVSLASNAFAGESFKCVNLLDSASLKTINFYSLKEKGDRVSIFARYGEYPLFELHENCIFSYCFYKASMGDIRIWSSIVYFVPDSKPDSINSYLYFIGPNKRIMAYHFKDDERRKDVKLEIHTYVPKSPNDAVARCFQHVVSW